MHEYGRKGKHEEKADWACQWECMKWLIVYEVHSVGDCWDINHPAHFVIPRLFKLHSKNTNFGWSIDSVRRSVGHEFAESPHLDLFNCHVFHINIASIEYRVRRRLGDIMYSVRKNILAPSPTKQVFSMEYIHTAHLVRLRPSMFFQKQLILTQEFLVKY